MRCLLCFFLQNGCSGRGCLNNICIASYGVGVKFFTTNLMSVDLPQNTPKTRKPIAERTSHRWLGCAVLPQNSQNTQNLAAWVWQGCHTLLICEHLWEALLCKNVPCVRSAGISFLPRMARMNTDGWGALFSHGWHGWTQNWAAWVWQGCHTLLICEHPCSSVGGSSLPEGSVCSVRSVGEHRSLVGALETSAPPTE